MIKYPCASAARMDRKSTSCFLFFGFGGLASLPEARQGPSPDLDISGPPDCEFRTSIALVRGGGRGVWCIVRFSWCLPGVLRGVPPLSFPRRPPGKAQQRLPLCKAGSPARAIARASPPGGRRGVGGAGRVGAPENRRNAQQKGTMPYLHRAEREWEPWMRLPLETQS